MKKNCGTCKHRVNGTDTHMVCSLRDYVLRVNSNDACSKYKSSLPEKKKRYIIGIGYPWYQDAFDSISGRRTTTHGCGSIKLYNKELKPDANPFEIITLDPKRTHNGKKYRLILEEV